MQGRGGRRRQGQGGGEGKGVAWEKERMKEGREDGKGAGVRRGAPLGLGGVGCEKGEEGKRGEEERLVWFVCKGLLERWRKQREVTQQFQRSGVWDHSPRLAGFPQSAMVWLIFWLRYISTTCSAVVACSGDLSVRTRTRRGKRRAIPLESWTRPTPAWRMVRGGRGRGRIRPGGRARWRGRRI